MAAFFITSSVLLLAVGLANPTPLPRPSLRSGMQISSSHHFSPFSCLLPFLYSSLSHLQILTKHLLGDRNCVWYEGFRGEKADAVSGTLELTTE